MPTEAEDPASYVNHDPSKAEPDKVIGPEKRYGLEEVKAPFSQSSDRDLSQPQPMVSNIDFQRGLVESRRAYDNRVLVQPNGCTAVDQQIISALWEKYTPSISSAQGGTPCVWLHHIISLPTRAVPLDLSLKAFAMTRIGWINKDESLVLQGNLCYGRALNAVQKHLSSEALMWQDELFAASYVLSIYELFESTTPSIAGWNSHISGLKHLVLMRGPQRHMTPFTRAVLEEFRTSSMIQCIQYRRSTFLGSPEWLTLPWSETGKDIFQQLYDKGFALAALLEGIDNARVTDENTNFSILSEYLGGLSGLDEELNLWYGEILQESPLPLYWSTQSTSPGWHLKQAVGPRTLPSFAFHTLRLANITVTYWGLRLILSNTIALACRQVLSINIQLPTQSSSSTPPQATQNLKTMSLHLLEAHTTAYRLELATNIIRSMPYCLNDKMGLMGAQKSLFALRTALFVLQRYPGQELKWCQAMYQELDGKKGLRYAREIAKLEGKHSAASRDDLPIIASHRRDSEGP
ncbi:hypothetical protein HO133_005830 [Letharia lupina]|uniref:Uncharacterized protein n=1 Tax=Letharia lupina TaxID=560253 RepID=A0A8H6F844_9LECA|nr:uncharacterized protein HO133_005830 [Letharia lupina]KAF6218481.1 hypothetical protein HO133_005830 [Letharia lupina]